MRAYMGASLPDEPLVFQWFDEEGKPHEIRGWCVAVSDLDQEMYLVDEDEVHRAGPDGVTGRGRGGRYVVPMEALIGVFPAGPTAPPLPARRGLVAICPTCSGDGFDDEADEECETCGGSGRVVVPVGGGVAHVLSPDVGTEGSVSHGPEGPGGAVDPPGRRGGGSHGEGREESTE